MQYFYLCLYLLWKYLIYQYLNIGATEEDIVFPSNLTFYFENDNDTEIVTDIENDISEVITDEVNSLEDELQEDSSGEFITVLCK